MWTSSASRSSSPPDSTTGILPTRRTPVTSSPTSASSGGLTLFSATIPGASADSTVAPRSAASRRRAVISTSGSSGTGSGCARRAGARLRQQSFARPSVGRLANIRIRTARQGGGPAHMQELPTIQAPPPVGRAVARRDRADVRRGPGARAQRDAVILAHNYELPELQDVADYVGDSLGLSRAGGRRPTPSVIAFCGVHFMAETASVLSPEKTVLIPDRDAGCSLADSIDADQLRAWKARAPRRAGRHVRQHLGRGQGRDRLLLHLLQRGQRRRAHLGRARPRAGDPLRPRHVARRLRRARDRPARGSRAARPLPRLGRRVPRPRRHQARRHRPDARRAPRGRVPDPPRVRLLDPGDGVRRLRRHLERGRPHALDLGDARPRRERTRTARSSSPPRPGCSTRSSRRRRRPT